MEQRRDGLEVFVGHWSETIRQAWDGLPSDVRSRLESAMGMLPGDVKRWRRLIDQAAEHLRLVGGRKQRVAIVGPANVGKSTLYNHLVRSGRDRTAVSAVPGTTRQAQQADAGLFTVIDTPGADAAGPVGGAEKKRALLAADTADVVLLMFDAANGVGTTGRSLYRELLLLRKPMVVALNKIDLVRGERDGALARAAEDLGLQARQIIPLAAKQGVGVDRVLLAVAKSEPGIVAALGAALPSYRWKLAQVAIARAASTAAAIAITPLPLMDFIPLIALQSAMVLGLARIYAYRITLARMRELLAAFGLGLLGRGLFYQLSRLGGPPGWLVAAAVAAGTTTGMGYAAAVWFERGERLSRDQMRRLSGWIGQRVIDRLRGLGRGRPRRIMLQEEIGRALGEIGPPGQEAVQDA